MKKNERLPQELGCGLQLRSAPQFQKTRPEKSIQPSNLNETISVRAKRKDLQREPLAGDRGFLEDSFQCNLERPAAFRGCAGSLERPALWP